MLWALLALKKPRFEYFQYISRKNYANLLNAVISSSHTDLDIRPTIVPIPVAPGLSAIFKHNVCVALTKSSVTKSASTSSTPACVDL